jgi:hypothetical protein
MREPAINLQLGMKVMTCAMTSMNANVGAFCGWGAGGPTERRADFNPRDARDHFMSLMSVMSDHMLGPQIVMGASLPLFVALLRASDL